MSADEKLARIMVEIAGEVARSIAKHGDQRHLPFGTGRDRMPLLFCGVDQTAENLAQQATYWTDERSHAEGDGTVTWERLRRAFTAGPNEMFGRA